MWLILKFSSGNFEILVGSLDLKQEVFNSISFHHQKIVTIMLLKKHLPLTYFKKKDIFWWKLSIKCLTFNQIFFYISYFENRKFDPPSGSVYVFPPKKYKKNVSMHFGNHTKKYQFRLFNSIIWNNIVTNHKFFEVLFIKIWLFLLYSEPFFPLIDIEGQKSQFFALLYLWILCSLGYFSFPGKGRQARARTLYPCCVYIISLSWKSSGTMKRQILVVQIYTVGDFKV